MKRTNLQRAIENEIRRLGAENYANAPKDLDVTIFSQYSKSWNELLAKLQKMQFETINESNFVMNDDFEIF